MLLINEENHSSICVVNYVFDGIVWLIREGWFDWDTIGIREDEEEFTLKDIIHFTNEMTTESCLNSRMRFFNSMHLH